MTGDELAAALYAEQGYLIAGGMEPRPIGSIFFDSIFKGDLGLVRTPLRIVSVSSREECLKQYRLAEKRGWFKADYPDIPSRFVYFYRVEAAD